MRGVNGRGWYRTPLQTGGFCLAVGGPVGDLVARIARFGAPRVPEFSCVTDARAKDAEGRTPLTLHAARARRPEKGSARQPRNPRRSWACAHSTCRATRPPVAGTERRSSPYRSQRAVGSPCRRDGRAIERLAPRLAGTRMSTERPPHRSGEPICRGSADQAGARPSVQARVRAWRSVSPSRSSGRGARVGRAAATLRRGRHGGVFRDLGKDQAPSLRRSTRASRSRRGADQCQRDEAAPKPRGTHNRQRRALRDIVTRTRGGAPAARRPLGSR